jgi:ethanolamine utilization protein EutN
MFLARIYGTVTATSKHPALAGVRLLVGRRIEGDGTESGEPMVIADTMGIGHGAVALITSDGDAIRARCGDNAPIRLSVLGQVPAQREQPS